MSKKPKIKNLFQANKNKNSLNICSLLNPSANIKAILEVVFLLRTHAILILEMSRGDLTGRYKGQIFGSIWIIIHPLALTLLYLFLFGVVFSQRMGGTRELPLDYTTYILSGLIPWLTFQISMSTSVISIIGNAPLVKQFIFPIEVLPIREVISSTLTWLVGISATLIYVFFTQHILLATWTLLPLVFTLQILAMIGVAFILSSAAVFFKDIKDFVQLFSLIAVYIMPIVFLPGWVPAVFRPMLWINPFTYMVWVYQDVIYFGRFEHPIAWFIFFGWSTFILAIGYRMFKRTKPIFGSLL